MTPQAAGAQTTADFRRPSLSSSLRYALVRDPEAPACAPVKFATLRSLAISLHQARRGEQISLTDADLQVTGEARPRRGVLVWTLDDAGEPRRCLGWAYLNGGGWTALQAALRAVAPEIPSFNRKAH